MLSFLTAQLSAEDMTEGIPWTGDPGVTETVGQIMERSKQPQPNGGGPQQLKRRALRNFSAHSQSPFSPVAAADPPSGEFIPQSTGTSFLGARLSDSGFIPPDSMGDVGPSQVVVFVNGRIRLFDRSGNVGALDTTPENFFSSVSSNGITDPRVRYDRLTGRWFILAIDIPNSKKNNSVVIAVSSGPTITDSTSFTFHSFKPSTLPPSNANTFADYPTLGVDSLALYIGTNVFNSAFYLGTEGYVVNKASLIAGTPVVTAFRNFATGAGAGMFTPQGVDNDDPASTSGYFIGVDNITHGLLVLRRISNPGGTPSISSNINLTVPTTEDPMGGVVAKGSAAQLDDLDDRLYAARMHHGSLWTAHNIEVNTSGIASTSGNRDAARWYEITNLNTTPTLRQSGTLFDPSASAPSSYFIPSCAVSGQGHMALSCSVAGANQYAEIAAAGRYADDPLGTIRAPSIIRSSNTPYGVSPARWGDYSVVSVDPNDDMTFWTFQEYCDATNSWAVRVIQLKAPPPVTPDTALPATALQGITTDVTVTGISTNGSGFFDPDPSFPNHIAVSLNGGDVTVNSVTVVSPTEVTLNLTIDPAATPGSRTISVINPDGQSATSATGILEITVANSPPVIIAAEITPAVPNTTEDLVAAVTASTDADGDPITFSYQWQHGADDIPFTNATLPSSATAAGESYRCVITPNDGLVDGPPFPTAFVTVANSPPVITAAQVTPSLPNTTQDLLASVTSSMDPDGDPLTFTYQWQHGASEIPYTSATLPASATAKGESYRCLITPNDGLVDGASFPTAYATVVNSPPVITAAEVTPALPNTTQDLVASVTSSMDPDGDPLTLAYHWQKGTSDIPYTTDTLPASATVAGENYRCLITPNDSILNGATFSTATVSVPLDFDANGLNDDWENLYFNTLGIDPLADADDDGMSNFQELAYGLDPTNGSSASAIILSPDKATGTFSYTRLETGMTGLIYSIWISTDLETWTEDTNAIQSPTAPVNQVETVVVTLGAPVPLASEQLFVQVRAVQASSP